MTTAVQKRHGKRYAALAALVEHGKAYGPQESVELVKKLASAKFDETVELHLRTASDASHTEQMVRGVASLPHGTGKTRRVLVFAQGEAATAARQAGADYIGDDELIKKIEGEGWADFEVSIATPDVMGRIGRLGRVLGRKGLMPNPRTGTVVQPQDLPRAVREAKGGRLEFRMDKTAIIHVPIGKASFSAAQLLENLVAIVDAVDKARPDGIKGQFVLTAYLSAAMGPSVKLDLAALREMKAD